MLYNKYIIYIYSVFMLYNKYIIYIYSVFMLTYMLNTYTLIGATVAEW